MPRKLPHHEVYTRIARSKIHGVGVFAIRAIKRGAHVFYGDNDKLLWVQADKLNGLSPGLKKLYDDFCIKRGERFGCPTNFNRMTVAWYLNHSGRPNVACDRSYRFYAIRNISSGEELTTDYGTYSEIGLRRLIAVTSTHANTKRRRKKLGR